MKHRASSFLVATLALALALAALWLRRPGPASAQPTPSTEVTLQGDTATPAASHAAGTPRAPVPPAELDEAGLMAELRRAKDRDPELTLALARDGNRRFPMSNDAAERAAAIVYALAALDRGNEGRGEAEDMVNRYPDSDWVRAVERFSGAHRHRNVRTNDAGQLEYY